MSATMLLDADPQLATTLVAAFAAAAFAVLAVVRSARPARERAERPVDPLPAVWRLAWPLVRLLEAPAAATLGSRQRAALEDRLQRAGRARQISPARHRAGCWVSAVAGGALLAAGWNLLAALVGAGQFASAPASIGIGAVVGGLLPVARLRDCAVARQRSMLRQLPFFLDLVTMSVEAGLNLGAALAQAVDRGPPGALRDEFSRLLHELRAGRAREEALRALAQRVQLPAVTNLVAALGVAHKQGASLGPILRAQAEQRRTERFLRAEKLAMEAPVKMLLPLVIFIFPGTFAVLLFPVVSRLVTEGVL